MRRVVQLGCQVVFRHHSTTVIKTDTSRTSAFGSAAAETGIEIDDAPTSAGAPAVGAAGSANAGASQASAPAKSSTSRGALTGYPTGSTCSTAAVTRGSAHTARGRTSSAAGPGIAVVFTAAGRAAEQQRQTQRRKRNLRHDGLRLQSTLQPRRSVTDS
jgi:hypothetical protein